MRSLGRFAFGFFLSAGGLFVLAVLESTVFFWFPFGVDAAVIILCVRHPELRWLYVALASAGSVLGTLITFWMGKRIGEAGLEQYVRKHRLTSTTAAVRKRGVWTAVLGLVPPPFPFTAFVMAAGAMGVDVKGFAGVLAVVRMGRFAVEALIAGRYGRSALRWLNSDVVQYVVVGIILVAIVGSLVSLIALLRKRLRAKG